MNVFGAKIVIICQFDKLDKTNEIIGLVGGLRRLRGLEVAYFSGF